MRQLGLFALLLCLASCTSYASFLRTTTGYLEDREITACLYLTASGGGGLGAGVNGSITGILITGGMDPAQCAFSRGALP